MFSIERPGTAGERPRLVADGALTAADFETIADKLGSKPRRARKTALIAARPATAGERIETQWNGPETVNKAKTTDQIVTAWDQ